MSDFKVREFAYRVETEEGRTEFHNVTSVSLEGRVLIIQTTTCINCFTSYINAYELITPKPEWGLATHSK